MAFKAVRNLFRDFVRLPQRIKTYALQEQENLRNALKVDQNGLTIFDGGVRPTGAIQKCQEIERQRQIFLNRYIRKFSRLFFRGNQNYSLLGRNFMNQVNRTSVLFGAVGFAYYGSCDVSQRNKLSMDDVLMCMNMVVHNKNKSDVPALTAPDSLKKIKLKDRLGEPSSSAAVYSAEYENKEYAVKVMFNYEYASNENAIKKGFARECCVASKPQPNHNSLGNSSYTLPSHPNIVQVLGAFIEETPCPEDALHSYPSALPRRLHANGFGRNKTLCLVMPKYDSTLRGYLEQQKPTDKEKLLVFAQLLEGVAHLVENYEAHRDLKADNILLEMKTGKGPKLVIADFGCCLGDRNLRLKLPFESDHVDRGGNSALMAPEISSAIPSRGGFLDYSKTDVWACGAIALEMFGICNPFTCGGLESRTYKDGDILLFCKNDDLVQQMTRALLIRDPRRRPTADEAAVMPVLILYAPESWGMCPSQVSDNDIKRWLTEMWIKLLRDEHNCFIQDGTIPAELSVRRCFLERAKTSNILSALKFLKNSVIAKET